jgi:hypothetical protein
MKAPKPTDIACQELASLGVSLAVTALATAFARSLWPFSAVFARLLEGLGLATPSYDQVVFLSLGLLLATVWAAAAARGGSWWHRAITAVAVGVSALVLIGGAIVATLAYHSHDRRGLATVRIESYNKYSSPRSQEAVFHRAGSQPESDHGTAVSVDPKALDRIGSVLATKGFWLLPSRLDYSAVGSGGPWLRISIVDASGTKIVEASAADAGFEYLVDIADMLSEELADRDFQF